MVRITAELGWQDTIQGGWTRGPNSAGGIGLRIIIKNETDKIVKYVRLKIVPYNTVNDVARCTISGKSEFACNCVGPLDPGKKGDFIFNTIWYNSTISSVTIKQMNVEYTDGSVDEYEGSQVPLLYGSDESGRIVTNTGGCYIATAVYGSYDCPQVWTLRRYRDERLAKSILGRLFIRFYYLTSPLLVKHFGKSTWFISSCRKPLDKMVSELREMGLDDTPYQDKSW